MYSKFLLFVRFIKCENKTTDALYLTLLIYNSFIKFHMNWIAFRNKSKPIQISNYCSNLFFLNIYIYSKIFVWFGFIWAKVSNNNNNNN